MKIFSFILVMVLILTNHNVSSLQKELNTQPNPPLHQSVGQSADFLGANANATSAWSTSVSTTFHVMMFIENDEAQGIYKACQSDKRLMKTLLNRATDATEASIKYYQTSFDKNSLEQTLTALKCTTNDVIVFFYSGHGYNNGQSLFPCLNFHESSSSSRHANLEEIHERLKTKGARLVLTIGDCCNNIAKSYQFPLSEPNIIINNYSKLFSLCKGDIIAASSKKGQFSGVYSNDAGSYFTVNFFQSFQEAVGSTTASWNNILMKTAERTEKVCPTQSPYYICNVRIEQQNNTGPDK